jgi:hypothetical protein
MSERENYLIPRHERMLSARLKRARTPLVVGLVAVAVCVGRAVPVASNAWRNPVSEKVLAR